MGIFSFIGGNSGIKNNSSANSKFKVSDGRDKFKSKLSKTYLSNKFGQKAVRFGQTDIKVSELGDKLYDDVISRTVSRDQAGIAKRLVNMGVDYENRKKILAAIRAKYAKPVAAGLSKELMKKFKDVPEKFLPKNGSKTAIKEAEDKYRKFVSANIGYTNLAKQREDERRAKSEKHVFDVETADGANVTMDAIGVVDKNRQEASVGIYAAMKKNTDQADISKTSISQAPSIKPVAGGDHGSPGNIMPGNFSANKSGIENPPMPVQKAA